MTQQHGGPGSPFHIRTDRTLTHPQVLNLLDEHLTAWRHAPSDSPDDDADGELLAMGALKELAPTTGAEGGHGELKSMRTSARHLRQGAAQAILTELLAVARQRGYARVSLETGSTRAFEPAMAMYRRFGFVECGPFADYTESPFSRFMTLIAEHLDFERERV